MISCALCFKNNENGRRMYNIEVILPKNHLEENEKGIICGSCLYDLIDKDSNLRSYKKINNIYAELEAHKLKFSF